MHPDTDFLDCLLLGNKKNGISAGPKVVSKIPYILQMVGIGRFDKEQSDAEREQRRPQVEQRKATPIKKIIVMPTIVGRTKR